MGQNEMSTSILLRMLSEKFSQLKLPYMLVGSTASSFYGILRSTRDIDIVIDPDPDQLTALAGLLPPAEFYYDLVDAQQALANRSIFNVIDNTFGWKIDFIILKRDAYQTQQFQRRVKAELEGATIYIQTSEDTVISKLLWSQLGGSVRQLEDVAGILKMRSHQLDMVYLQKWVNELNLDTKWKESQKIAEG
jgi:hypothetical protein